VLATGHLIEKRHNLKGKKAHKFPKNENTCILVLDCGSTGTKVSVQGMGEVRLQKVDGLGNYNDKANKVNFKNEDNKGLGYEYENFNEGNEDWKASAKNIIGRLAKVCPAPKAAVEVYMAATAGMRPIDAAGQKKFYDAYEVELNALAKAASLTLDFKYGPTTIPGHTEALFEFFASVSQYEEDPDFKDQTLHTERLFFYSMGGMSSQIVFTTEQASDDNAKIKEQCEAIKPDGRSKWFKFTYDKKELNLCGASILWGAENFKNWVDRDEKTTSKTNCYPGAKKERTDRRI